MNTYEEINKNRNQNFAYREELQPYVNFFAHENCRI